jgi:hypothetical protein
MINKFFSKFWRLRVPPRSLREKSYLRMLEFFLLSWHLVAPLLLSSYDSDPSFLSLSNDLHANRL